MVRRVLGYVHYRKQSPPSEPGPATAIGIFATAIGVKIPTAVARCFYWKGAQSCDKIQGRRRWCMGGGAQIPIVVAQAESLAAAMISFQMIIVMLLPTAFPVLESLEMCHIIISIWIS